MFNRDIAIGGFRFVELSLPPSTQTAELVLDWKINQRGMLKTLRHLAEALRPWESTVIRALKYPFRVSKWIALGIDCDWRKHTVLIKPKAI